MARTHRIDFQLQKEVRSAIPIARLLAGLCQFCVELYVIRATVAEDWHGPIEATPYVPVPVQVQ